MKTEEGIKVDRFPELRLKLILETLSLKERSLFFFKSFCRLQFFCLTK